MPLEPPLTEAQLAALRRFDTPTVSNAVETFQVRLRNTGFTDASVRCLFPDLPPMVGYAATACLRSGDPPIEGHSYHDRTEWWYSILEMPAPRVVVLQDMDSPPGRGAFLGDMHCAILKALGCVGYVTNGAVRDLPAVHKMEFPLFAGNVAVSHAYAHIFHAGTAVTVGGLEVRPGDLMHADQHGVLCVPREVAGRVPPVAQHLLDAEHKVIEFCDSPEFTPAKLRELIKALW
jgi:4-hydroxy-4-methyl-2-oxoglutarate aldolase